MMMTAQHNLFIDPKSLFTGGFWKKTSGLLFIWRLQQSSAIFRGDVDQNNKNLVQLWLLAVVQPSILESKVFSSLLVSSPFSYLTLSLMSYLLLSNMVNSSVCPIGGICPSRQCRLQCKIFASGVNFSIFTHFLCFFLLKLLKLGKIDGVKF